MEAKRKISAELLTFIDNSPSSFHAVAQIQRQLKAQGFKRLRESQKWQLEPGQDYYVTRNDSAIIAFQLPVKSMDRFYISASHSDSPTFKIKENPEINVEQHYQKLNVEKYGGMICSSWFDRPLSVAGRILGETGDGIVSRLVNIDQDLLMIPNLAIHMNREINQGYTYNAQVDLLPVYGSGDTRTELLELITAGSDISRETILGMDLFLYNRMKGIFWGAAEEYLAAPRLDDLQCAYAALQGFLECRDGRPENIVPVYCVFDNEETGSRTKQGAASGFLKDTLKRISETYSEDREHYHRSLAGSFMISADNAHGVHPNHPEKADPTNRPYLNGGIVIKHHAGQQYTTDGVSGAIMKQICRQAEVPYQSFTNRSDMAGGSTLGNISGSQVSINTVDIGLAQWAMHSAYESAGAEDTYYLKEAMRTFYSHQWEWNA